MKIAQVSSANIFISGGTETYRQRDIAVDTFRSIEQMYGRLGTALAIRNWDFRIEAGETIAAGTFARRSLDEARKANAVIGILGTDVPLPAVTRQELKDFYERHAAGEQVEIAVFMKTPVSRAHTRWRRGIERKHNIQVIYEEFSSTVEFQRRLFARLMIMLLPILPPAATHRRGVTT